MSDDIDLSGRFSESIVNVKSPVYQFIQAAPVDARRVAGARARLAALPSDPVPAIAPLPAGSRVPLAPNPLFVGREPDLKALAAALSDGATVAIGQIAAATGLGGIGKTQLAAEFVHRYGQYFDGGVFWLNFAAADAVPPEIAACGGAGALDLRPDFGNLPVPDQIRLVLGAWLGPLPRLLVFDNCEDEILLSKWRPPSGGSRVLLTSRRAAWSSALGVRARHLGVLDRAESIDLLQKHLREHGVDLAATDASAIAAELGDLPLALHLAGCFLARYRYAAFGTPAAYLAQLRQPDLLAHRSLITGDLSPTGHEQHVARTFALSYDRLRLDDPVDATALALLSRAVCFAPGEPIPRDLLIASLGSAPGDADVMLRAEDAVARLTDLALIEQQPTGALAVHRLLAAFVQSASPDGFIQAQTGVEETVLKEASRLNRAGFPAPLLSWQPHFRYVAGAADARGGHNAGGLYNELGYHLRMVADLAGARAAYERAVAIGENSLGPDHPTVAGRVSNLGLVLHDLGDLPGARVAFERALAIDEKTFGSDHPSVAIRMNNLGGMLHDLGDLAGARAAFERALAIDEKALGPDHPDVAINVNNLGTVLRALGDLGCARAAFERALAIDEKALGPDHPDVAIDVNNLGGVLWDLGDLAAARAAYERALRLLTSTLPPNHPKIRTAQANLHALEDKSSH